MIFDNKPISEITDQELIDLISNQEENLCIDFKKEHYSRDNFEDYKHEICKDVTAMANSEGGYIIIGILERNKVAQKFFSVPDAQKAAKSIKSICLKYIDLPILNLEVALRTFEHNNDQIDLVVIHIPQSERVPHGFQSKGTLNFVKRDEDGTREYSMSELTKDFLDHYHPPFVAQISNQLTEISKHIQAGRKNSISPQDDPLEQAETENLLHLMKLRSDEAIADQPYYRICAVPQELTSDKVDTRSEDIRETMYNPPDRRYGNFGVTGILEREKVLSYEGISGPNVTGGEITLLKNGYLEVRCPLRDTQFQWRREESRISADWLYPYVVCEFPVTFLKLVKKIYQKSGIDSKVLIRQEYHNLTGFMLPRGNPSNIGFGAFQDESNVYALSRPIISKQTVPPDFDPEQIAYELVKDVYEYFGLDPQWIPAFDEDGHFILE